jgi:hypothetical protein
LAKVLLCFMLHRRRQLIHAVTGSNPSLHKEKMDCEISRTPGFALFCLQGRLREAQQQLTAANAALQQLNRQMQSINTQEKQAIGAKSRAAHKVQQLQVSELATGYRFHHLLPLLLSCSVLSEMFDADIGKVLAQSKW